MVVNDTGLLFSCYIFSYEFSDFCCNEVMQPALIQIEEQVAVYGLLRGSYRFHLLWFHLPTDNSC